MAGANEICVDKVDTGNMQGASGVHIIVLTALRVRLHTAQLRASSTINTHVALAAGKDLVYTLTHWYSIGVT